MNLNSELLFSVNCRPVAGDFPEYLVKGSQADESQIKSNINDFQPGLSQLP